MRVPLSWINEFVPVSHSGEEIAERLTVAGVEVEAITPAPAEHGPDTVLTLAILPNIARCYAITGVAREIAAVMDTDLRGTPPPAPLGLRDGDGPITPALGEGGPCKRFGTALIEGVRVTPSPKWMQDRLNLAGVGPINNIVDASNYVMLELGQPTHCYDADRLPALKLAVRPSRGGERMRTLAQNDEEAPADLPAGTLLIDAGGTPVAVAGVIGGRATAVHDGTTRVLLEAANFDMLATRRSQRLVNTFTDASARFSRGVDPALVPVAMGRIVELLRETCPGLRVVDTGHRTLGAEDRRDVLRVRLSDINAALGTSYAMSESLRTLERVGLTSHAVDSDAIHVTVTSARNDIAIERDLCEEITRLIGYDRMPMSLPTGSKLKKLEEPGILGRRRIHAALIASGLGEIMSYSLTAADAEQRLRAGDAAAPGPFVAVTNAISPERTVMRRSLLPGLLEAAAPRLRSGSPVRIFEIGQVFLPRDAADMRKLAEEPYRAGVLIAGPAGVGSVHGKAPRPADFFDLKGVVERAIPASAAPAPAFEAGTHPSFQPGQTARVLLGGEPIGWMGKLHPDVAEAFGLKDAAVFAAEIDLAPVVARQRLDVKVIEPSAFPSVDVDLSFMVGRDATAAALLACGQRAAGPMLERAEVFDVFSSGADAARKSVAIRLVLNARTRSMRTEEAMEARAAVAAALKAEFAAEVRE